MSNVLHIDSVDPEESSINQAVAALKEGGLIVAPSETQYGLLALAGNQSAVERLFSAKGRPLQMPTAIFVEDTAQVEEIAEVSVQTRRIMDTFLPGPLTVVLNAKVSWPAPLVVDGKIGIRVSPSPVIKALLQGCDAPLTATSANLSGESDIHSVDQIKKRFGNKISLYLDAGPLKGASSTVIDCTSDEVSILRNGPVSLDEINASLQQAGKA